MIWRELRSRITLAASKPYDMSNCFFNCIFAEAVDSIYVQAVPVMVHSAPDQVARSAGRAAFHLKLSLFQKHWQACGLVGNKRRGGAVRSSSVKA